MVCLTAARVPLLPLLISVLRAFQNAPSGELAQGRSTPRCPLGKLLTFTCHQPLTDAARTKSGAQFRVCLMGRPCWPISPQEQPQPSVISALTALSDVLETLHAGLCAGEG